MAIKGLFSGRYLAMNKRGRLYASVSPVSSVGGHGWSSHPLLWKPVLPKGARPGLFVFRRVPGGRETGPRFQAHRLERSLPTAWASTTKKGSHDSVGVGRPFPKGGGREYVE